MISINVFSEEKAWSKRLKNKDIFFKKIFLIIRYLPILQRFASGYSKAKNQSRRKTGMYKAEDAKILGINENSTDEEIISAHKKEMQKHHPDKGGSKDIAAKINAAKDTLLS